MTEDRSESLPTPKGGSRPYAAPFFRRLDVDGTEAKAASPNEDYNNGVFGPAQS